MPCGWNNAGVPKVSTAVAPPPVRGAQAGVSVSSVSHTSHVNYYNNNNSIANANSNLGNVSNTSIVLL